MDAAGWAKLKDWFGEAIESTPARLREITAEAERESPELAAELAALLKEHAVAALDTRAMTPQLPRAVEVQVADGPRGGMIGPYRVIREIGRGGTGIVFLAEREDDEFHRTVAVKVLRYVSWDAKSHALLTQERRMLAQLQHPQIAQLLDWGETPDEAPWLAMEYVEGLPIDEYCRSKQLGLGATLSVFEQVCEAVQYAHRRLVVHRDLKPANILVTSAGLVKLLDFGISKLLDDETPTHTIDRRFTPAFASPEQLAGENISATSDVYALGIILYDLVTNTLPFNSGSVEDIVRRLSDEEWPPPSSRELRAGIDRRAIVGDFDRIVLHALARRPDRRYQSVEQLLTDLSRFREGFPVSAQSPTLVYRTTKFLARNALPVALGASAVIALAGGAAVSIRNAQAARRAAQLAERRFNDVRHLAHSVIFELHDEIRKVPGSVKARRVLVDTATKYLDSLHAEDTADDALQMELAEAYIRIGYIQGGVAGVNLSDTAVSMKSYRTVIRILEEQARKRPGDPRVRTLTFSAVYNLSMMINDPAESIACLKPYVAAADAWRSAGIDGTVPSQVSWLLHMALGRMLRLSGAYDLALGEYDIAARINRELMPMTATSAGPRPMFGGDVPRVQAMFDGGLIHFGRAETLLLLNRCGDALASAETAEQMFVQGHPPDELGPSDRRAMARVPTLKARAFACVGRVDEALAGARKGAALALENTLDGSGTGQRDLAEARWRLAAVLTRKGAAAEAVTELEAAADTSRALAAADKVLTLNRAFLAEILNDLGDALVRVRRAGDAASAFREASAVAGSAAVEAPSWPALAAARDRADAAAKGLSARR